MGKKFAVKRIPWLKVWVSMIGVVCLTLVSRGAWQSPGLATEPGLRRGGHAQPPSDVEDADLLAEMRRLKLEQKALLEALKLTEQRAHIAVPPSPRVGGGAGAGPADRPAPGSDGSAERQPAEDGGGDAGEAGEAPAELGQALPPADVRARKAPAKGGAPAAKAEASDDAEAGDEDVADAGDDGDSYWIFCAGQWQGCLCGGDVRWGDKQTWKYIKKPKGKKTHEVKCSIDVLGDSLPGVDSKHCQCKMHPGSDFEKAANPGLLPSTRARLITSCDSFRKGANDGAWGKAQWEAVEPFCSETWPSSEEGKAAKAGPRAMPLKMMQGLMDSWIDMRFDDVYDKYFKQGWTDYAFLNYYGGPPDGKHAAMTEQLVRSVHEFSEHPVLVFHFGVVTPDWWTPEKYPRLVLIHSRPMDASASRSFNFNKLRAMLISRAKVGIQLDSDQFVAPGVDAMFRTTEREITQEYAMPILPAHFLDRTPRDTGDYWRRFCPQDECKFQTARWGHAHPTWTYWATPWLGRWLRRNFRDETLQMKEGGSMAALRILNIPEDEDLLNVATWEDKGTKQWCKLDLPGPDDFVSLLNHNGDIHTCKHGCGDITSDRRYHPGGVAKVFYTAHHAVVPHETAKYIDRLIEKRNSGSLPPPILYKGHFYEDGDKLREKHPEITCII